MVQSGTLFEYLAAFITIVLGLALADLLVSLHRLLRARRQVAWRPLPLLLAVFVFLSLLTGFFELWDMTRWERLGYYGLVWQVCLYLPFFLATCAVLPDEVPAGGLDLDRFYFAERRYVVALLAIGLVLDMIDATGGSWADEGLNGLTDPDYLLIYLPLNLLCLAALATIAFSARRWTHWFSFTVLFGVAHLGFSVWTIRGASAMAAAAPPLP